MGIRCPLGRSVAEFEANLFAGASGIVPIRGTLVAQDFPVPFAGFLGSDEPDSRTPDLQQCSRSASLSRASLEEAAALLPYGTPIDAIVFGTAEGVAFDTVQTAMQTPAANVDPELLPCAEEPLQIMAEWLRDQKGCTVPSHRMIAVNSACASGNQAIGEAMQRIRAGVWQRAIVGGVDARCTAANLMNFHMLGALCVEDVAAVNASRPFSKDRSGFVRSEGAAVFILESLEAAEQRGAEILGEVLGYGATSDSFRLTDGRSDGMGVQAAMRRAVADAGLDLRSIGAISAHGTSTLLNDKLETEAIKAVFGEMAYEIPVTSLKSQLGHTTVAAGALEAVSCVLMMNRKMLAPTINLVQPDPECDLDYVPNVCRPKSVNAMLSNNFGFGGQNACLVFGVLPS
jgi:3-oxoacyl-(acyl-carrier-protein) synthase